MLRRALLLAALAAIACSKAPSKKGPYVARGNGIVITSEELKARLDEQSPMIRSSFQNLDRKKQFLDNLIRFELLAKAAEKEGLANDPDVQFTMKKVMVSKYYQKHFQDQKDATATVPEAEIKKYYDEHQKDEFFRPGRLHPVHLFVKAEQAAPDRAQKLAEAKKLLAKVQGEEKKDPMALSRIAKDSSDDAATKTMGGDLGFKTSEELEKQYGKEFVAGIAKLADNTTSSVIETPQGFHIARVLGRQPEMSRSFDEAKGQIAAKLNGQKRTKDFDDLLKKLRDDAHLQIYDAELEKVQVAAAPAGGAPHGGMGPMGGGMGRPAPSAMPAGPAAQPAKPQDR